MIEDNEVEKRRDARRLCDLVLGDALKVMGDALLVDALACGVIFSVPMVDETFSLFDLRMSESRLRLGVFLIEESIGAGCAGDTRKRPQG